MNIEDYREFCLSLGEDVEEKLPFTAFRYASGVLAFYVHGHMFSFFVFVYCFISIIYVLNGRKVTRRILSRLVKMKI